MLTSTTPAATPTPTPTATATATATAMTTLSPPTATPTPSRAQRGFSLAEALVAALILGFALLVGLSVVIWADRIEQRASLRVAAAELAGSVAERVRAAPYGTLATGELDVSDEILADLPEPVVELEVTEDDELHLKHVGVVVSWGGGAPGRLRVDTSVGDAEVYRR